MLNVSLSSKQAYLSDTSHKNLRVIFPGWGESYTNNSVDKESLKLTEALADKESVEFVGCIASTLQISLYDVVMDIKGSRIEVYINTDGEEDIPLFKGIVDSATIDAENGFKKITAYDELYSVGEKDIVDWYNTTFPMLTTELTMKQIRDSLFAFIGIEQEDIELPNDNVIIKKKFDPKSLKCITVIKSICQINGCFGIINRFGKFEYRYLSDGVEGLYPGLTTFPGPTTFPSKGSVEYRFGFHEKVEYQEYFVKPTEKIQIRSSEKDSGVIVGEGTNKYIIQANMFAQGLEAEVLEEMANNILDKIGTIKFHPFKATNYGCPFIEVGDVIEYSSIKNSYAWNKINRFTVLSRTLSGIQLLDDVYNAKGSEEQSEFVTDLQAQLDAIKMNGGGGSGDSYTKEEVDEKISEMETPTGFTVVSCVTLPESRRSDCIYLVKGDITMV